MIAGYANKLEGWPQHLEITGLNGDNLDCKVRNAAIPSVVCRIKCLRPYDV